VLDLIDVTAKAMAEHGGKHPVLLATPATVEARTYERKLNEASGGKVSLLRSIGAKSWAPLINNLDHLSTKPKDERQVAKEVREFVDQVPREATSVWLCCTHYPALKSQIEEQMAKRGLGHIPVVDPMEYQADSIIEFMKDSRSSNQNSHPDLNRPLVLTTGKLRDVQESTSKLLGESAEVVRTKFDPPGAWRTDRTKATPDAEGSKKLAERFGSLRDSFRRSWPSRSGTSTGRGPGFIPSGSTS
jgi:glutamate racemase